MTFACRAGPRGGGRQVGWGSSKLGAPRRSKSHGSKQQSKAWRSRGKSGPGCPGRPGRPRPQPHCQAPSPLPPSPPLQPLPCAAPPVAAAPHEQVGAAGSAAG
jgi:hypothetical protein